MQRVTEESEFGKFGWVIDPEGNRIELWEPPQERKELPYRFDFSPWNRQS